jgi:hypothetical protein
LSIAPTIVVFTKYDFLINKFERELHTEENQDMAEDEFDLLVQQKASEFFEEVCVKPLKRVTESMHGSIPHIAISSEAAFFFWLPMR